MGFINNNSGGTSGNQRIGVRVVNTGAERPKTLEAATPYINAQQFDGTKQVSISSLTGLYNDRFDDTEYYE